MLTGASTALLAWARLIAAIRAANDVTTAGSLSGNPRHTRAVRKGSAVAGTVEERDEEGGEYTYPCPGALP